MNSRFWSFDPDAGFQRHATEEQAKGQAQAALDWYRGESANEGWDEDVERICWGEIREAIVMTKERDLAVELATATTDEEREDVRSDFGPWDALVEYGLAPVTP